MKHLRNYYLSGQKNLYLHGIPLFNSHLLLPINKRIYPPLVNKSLHSEESDARVKFVADVYINTGLAESFNFQLWLAALLHASSKQLKQKSVLNPLTPRVIFYF